MREPKRLEQLKPLQTIPERVVKALDTRVIPPETKVVDQTEEAVVYRLFSRRVQLPKLGPVILHVDYRHYHQTYENDFDMIGFQYEGEDALVGEMQFLLMPDGRYGLSHRYVPEKYQGNGAGHHLLQQAEATLQAIANRRQQPVDVALQLGQRNVLEWFQNRGYHLADERSAAIAKDLQDHPEHYVFADIQPKDEHDIQVRRDGIFFPETTGRTIEDTVRINLAKHLEAQS